MEKKEKIFFVLAITFALLILVVSSVYVSALTAKIGNARMILSSESGDKVERYIRVINDNDVSANITIFASGDLENNTKILDSAFILKPGEEKNARFTIYSDAIGKYETKINVQFNPASDKENGAGLASLVILNVYEKGQLPEVNTNIRKSPGFENVGAYILGLVAVVLIIVVVVLFYISGKKRVKNGGELNKLKYHERDK
ncbi:MAG: hypothetical protein AABX03_02760 [Nanoarchaeota archaeon]